MTTTDKWNGSGDWEANPSDWSAGIPTPTTPAEIQSGTPTSFGYGSPRTRLLVAGAGIFLK